MIRLGRYDAFDKWEILCRYWEDRASLPDFGVDRFERPLVQHWDAIALADGTKAIQRSIEGAEPQSIGRRVAEAIARNGYSAPVDGVPAGIADSLRQVFKEGALRGLRWTDDIGEIPDIEVTRTYAKGGTPFPSDAIKGKRNVLCLFCARFYGRNDVIHVHDAAPEHGTLVDKDADSIEAMTL